MNYCCEKCGKVFKQKSHYDNHNKRKKPCKKNNKILDTIDKLVDNKIKNLIFDIDKNQIINMKKELGQFYTKNYDYILQNISIPTNIKDLIEPFAGEGDLLEYIEKSDNKYNVIMYDIDPKKEDIIQRDTLLNPPEYNGRFVITNPPYLARNKSENKEIYDKYNVNDLYKCFIVNLIDDNCDGGIMIIPLNFISSTRKNDVLLRERFLSIYSITQINIFEEQVFSDTSCTVCSLLFNKINDTIKEINIDIYPSKINIKTKLNKENNYTIGGEIYNLVKNNKYTMKRLTTKKLAEKNTNIVIKCIDDNSKSMIRAEYVNEDKDIFIDNTPKCSARGYLTLIINPTINEDKQKKVVNDFNNYLSENRKKYNSLFLANYRESNDIARKRISFDLVYKIIGHLID